MSFKLPNQREVFVKELLYKDLRNFSLYKDSTLPGRLNFLDTFIHTKNLNILEKLHAFIYLRKKCIGETVQITSNTGSVGVQISYIEKNLGGIEDISETICVDNATYVLNYPCKFNLGDTDFILSIIESIELDGEKIITADLTDKEYIQVFKTLPKKIYSHLKQFIKKNENYFLLDVLTERANLDVKNTTLNILTTDLPAFIVDLFDCVNDYSYRELLFVLCKRIPDVNFLINSTYLELDDYYILYKSEVEKENENLQSSQSI